MLTIVSMVFTLGVKYTQYITVIAILSYKASQLVYIYKDDRMINCHFCFCFTRSWYINVNFIRGPTQRKPVVGELQAMSLMSK